MLVFRRLAVGRTTVTIMLRAVATIMHIDDRERQRRT
jgi:hypothetical protein